MPLRRNRFVTWLAALAVALNALLPFTVQAAPSLTTTICSAEGARTVDLPGVPAHEGALHQHCKLCVAGSDRSPALSSSAQGALPIAPAAYASPAARTPAASPLALATPAQPRAPPAVS